MFCIVLLSIITGVLTEDAVKTVVLDVGTVVGEKNRNGDYYEFYGIPYATAPTGRDRFKAPLPLKPNKGFFAAHQKIIVCQQVYLTESSDDEQVMLHGVEDCLRINLLVPEVANENNLVPVIVYIHGGAFSGGHGNLGKSQHLVRHDVISINFNYRLGAIGFACLGTEDIPGNAALKDQLAALKWIKKYIKKFGGDPNKITLAGYSVGASMAEILALSKASNALIDKLILESGSALSPFAINRNPLETARNIAISIGYNDTGRIEDLNEFLLNVSDVDLAINSKIFYSTNSTFGFAPCIENELNGSEAILTKSPLDILKSGDYKKLPVLTGFSNMEGISRLIKFREWRNEMNNDLTPFLPADLVFDDVIEKENFVQDIIKHYFNGEEVSYKTLQGYVDYFSDSMFKYAIMRSAKLHAAKSNKPVFLYEFKYTGDLNMQHSQMDRIKGAGHRDQSAYILDFLGLTKKYKDMDVRDQMTTMWTDFVKYEDPTAYESALIDLKWAAYSEKEPNHMEIGHKLKMKTDLFARRYQFWNEVYEKYYWNPTQIKTKM